MSQQTQETAQTAEEARKQRVAVLISQTEHVGKKYDAGSPNNSPKSTIPGMLAILDFMLSKYSPRKTA